MRACSARPGLHEAVIGVLLIALLLAAAALDPAFVTGLAQLGLSGNASELLLLALPTTLIIIAGGIDLSVGSTMALSAVSLGLLFEARAPLWILCIAPIAVGAAAGAVNGLFVAYIRVHPLIVTLASLAAFRGLALGISRGRPISGFPPALLRFGDTVAGVPIPVLIAGALALITIAVMWRTLLGFRIYAIGDNERAARYAGIPVDRIRLLLFTLSGASAGLAALLFVARRNTAKADAGTLLELDAITAVVLGGASIAGGSGTVIGSILGVALTHELREFIGWHWQQNELILIVTGAVLIASVLANNLASRRRT